MKIGILTFHWGTNYGAILQAWCLQEYLTVQGHEVEIIDYMPSQYEFSWLRIARHPSLWKDLVRSLANNKKESLLQPFRKKYLHTTRRFQSVKEFGGEIEKFDVLISGSDQVLNPGFTLHGENGAPSPVYWLGVGRKDARRVGYAVSFGREHYPDDAALYAKKLVCNINAIGVREQTGLQILDSLNYKGPKCIVPDPTVLLGNTLFEKLGIETPSQREDYICVYMLRHEIHIDGNICYIDEKHKPLTMKEWIKTIVSARGIITNSYHGTLMAIYAHVPFAVLLETGRSSGMNDRFYTMFNRLGCIDRVAKTVEDALRILTKPVDFALLDKGIMDYREEGIDFLKKNII